MACAPSVGGTALTLGWAKRLVTRPATKRGGSASKTVEDGRAPHESVSQGRFPGESRASREVWRSVLAGEVAAAGKATVRPANMEWSDHGAASWQ